jgi:hypothetical protein
VTPVCQFPLLPVLKQIAVTAKCADDAERAPPKGPSVWERLRKPEQYGAVLALTDDDDPVS